MNGLRLAGFYGPRVARELAHDERTVVEATRDTAGIVFVADDEDTDEDTDVDTLRGTEPPSALGATP